MKHTVWWHVIRLIMAAHFHVAPHEIAEIDYWRNNAADDPTAVWSYGRDLSCDYRTWGSYDVCIR